MLAKVPVTRECCAFDSPDAMAKNIERPFCCNRRVELFERPCGSIAGISKYRLALFVALAVHLLEGRTPEENLATDFQPVRRFPALGMQGQWNRADSF